MSLKTDIKNIKILYSQIYNCIIFNELSLFLWFIIQLSYMVNIFKQLH